jgi:hypothetical protein
MNLKKEIIKIVTEIQDEFRTDELAYLAITSKIEHALRDRIAFSLHKLHQDNYLICREWCKDRKRTDLAILGIKDTKPKLLIEFKARSVPGYSNRDTNHLLDDLKKMAVVADEKTPLYCIFFNTCIQKKIDPQYSEAVKYLARINKRINYNKTINAMIDDFWMKHLKGLPKNKFEKIELKAGVYYSTPVSIITYVYGPIFKAELLGRNSIH